MYIAFYYYGFKEYFKIFFSKKHEKILQIRKKVLLLRQFKSYMQAGDSTVDNKVKK